MNYEKIYDALMQSRKLLTREKGKGTYYELHHIKPKSLFPELKNDADNLVLLTSREHYLAHALLCKIYADGPWHFKMCAAFIRFCTGNVENKIYGSSRLYEQFKNDWRAYMSEFHRTRPRNPESYKKMVETRTAKGNLKHSDETKLKISEHAKLQWSDETNRLKMSEIITEYFKTHPGRGPKGHKFGPRTPELIAAVKDAVINSEKWKDRYYKVECIETGERYSQSMLAEQLNIPRHKLKPLIKNEEEIDGKHYRFKT